MFGAIQRLPDLTMPNEPLAKLFHLEANITLRVSTGILFGL